MIKMSHHKEESILRFSVVACTTPPPSVLPPCAHGPPLTATSPWFRTNHPTVRSGAGPVPASGASTTLLSTTLGVSANPSLPTTLGDHMPGWHQPLLARAGRLAHRPRPKGLHARRHPPTASSHGVLGVLWGFCGSSVGVQRGFGRGTVGVLRGFCGVLTRVYSSLTHTHTHTHIHTHTFSPSFSPVNYPLLTLHSWTIVSFVCKQWTGSGPVYA